MSISTLHRLAAAATPDPIRSYVHRYVHRHQIHRDALRLPLALNSAESMNERVRIAREHRRLGSNQMPGEILALVTLLAERQPAVLCEIGADRGGTLALLASVSCPSARLLSLDVAYRPNCQTVYPLLARPAQVVTCMERDSHQPETRDAVKQWLAGSLFDFLFIDGDHSYAGVKSDYEMYGSLVKPGGLIALHDIVPDYRTRFGTVTGSNAGEVYRFWDELRKQEDSWQELIDDPEQDGYGIGIVHVQGELK